MNFFEEIYKKYICLNLKDYPALGGVNFEINKLLFFVFLGLAVACVIINYNESNISSLLKKLIRTEAYSADNAKKLSELGLDKNRAIKRLLSRGSGAVNKIITYKGKLVKTFEDCLLEEKAIKDKKRAARLRFFKSSKQSISSTDTLEEKEASLDALTDTEGSATEQHKMPISDKPDFDTLEFYIPEQRVEYAKRYVERKHASLGRTVLSCFILLGFYIALVFAMPHLLSAVNSIMGG